MKSLISIIVPVYNPGSYFKKTLESIVNQSYQNIEVIVIDDCSGINYRNYIDQTCSIDDRIILHRLLKNSGGGKARNEGLKKINGEFVAFCDSDDFWPKDKIEKQVLFMIETGCSISHCDMVMVDSNGTKLGCRNSSDTIDLKDFLSTTSLFCSSALLRTNIINGVKFGEKRARHPFKFWCGLLRNGYISRRASSTFFYYTVRKGSVSSNKVKMIFYTLYAYIVYSGRPFSAPYFLAKRFL